jgi:demethylmenaquinone methyltransferase/2-methoxy-6-polyprenyl-1,4-benzoquinol methylase
VTYRTTFNCLWCGASHAVRGPDDLEGFAQLCPDCIGRAGENGFLRFRLKAALAEQATSQATSKATSQAAGPVASPVASPAQGRVDPAASEDLSAEMRAYYQARAPEYDDWYLRQGRYARGPVHDLAWNTELDQATLWLDSLPLQGEIVELAAGTGWWSTLLAGKGVLSLYDANEGPLDRARSRLLAHGLRAHIHVRDAWAAPDRAVDALFCGFWLSHVPRARLAAFLELAHAWLKPGGMFAFIDSRPDPHSGAIDQPVSPDGEVSSRQLADGRTFNVVKVYWQPAELERALGSAGFGSARVTTTERFFLLGQARA